MLSKRIGLMCLIAVLILGITACDFDVPQQTTPVKSVTACAGAGGAGKLVEAWVAMRFMIEDHLVAPSTARFHGGGRSPHVAYLGSNRYRVEGSVDSQNGFGAMVRTQYRGVVRDECDEHKTWVLESIHTDP